MRSIDAIVLVEDVHSALQQYHHAARLERHVARRWPAVIERSHGELSISAAIQQLLDQALAALTTRDSAAAQLLRSRFVEPRPLTAPNHSDTQAIHQQIEQALDALTTTIIQINRNSTRGPASRFKLRQPVVSLDQRADQLHAALHDPQAAAIIVIEGVDGRGKTTLARLVAARCAADDTFAGVLWADARQTMSEPWSSARQAQQVAALNPDDLMLELARELTIDLSGDMAAIRAGVQAHCALSRYLIVIDNLEGKADLTALLPVIERLTSRSCLLIAVRDQGSDSLPSALIGGRVRLEPLDELQSYELLRRAATSIDASELAHAGDAELARIYTVVGGNPLALWLIAAQAQDRPWQQVLDELRAGQSAGHAPYDALYRSIWRRLSDDARTVLFAMHRCEAGAEHELLFTLSMLDQPRFAAAIDELRRRWLLAFDGRYTIHPLTYSFLRAVIAGW